MATPRPTVLLVDDEPHSLAAMRMALEDEFDCVIAADTEAGVARMEEEWVQVVICDQRMPGRTGVEFLTELRDRWPDAVRIIITGYTDPAAMAQAINEAGMSAWHLRCGFWPRPTRPSWKSAAPPCVRGWVLKRCCARPTAR